MFDSVRRKLIALGPIILGLSACAGETNPEIVVGFSAGEICSRYFISGQSEAFITDVVIQESLAKLQDSNNPDEDNTVISIDEEGKKVTVVSEVDGESYSRTSVYRDGLGCTLAYERSPEEIQAETIEVNNLPTEPAIPSDFGPDANTGLEISLDEFFFEEDNNPYADRYNTFGVLVAHQGKIIAERYDHDHNQDVPVLSQSMGKTVTALLTGIFLEESPGRSIDDVVVTSPHTITLENLLTMSSGLKWTEFGTGANNDLGIMWFKNSNSAEYAINKGSEYLPGTKFEYSTGTTQIIADYLGKELGGEIQSTYDFYQTQFFQPLGIENAIVEYDEGNVVRLGSSIFLKPHDWMKIGQLILDEGQWGNEGEAVQLVSAEWVQTMKTTQTYGLGIFQFPAPYGYQLWLKQDHDVLPDNTVVAIGYRGQYLVVVPGAEEGKDLVVFRYGAYGSNNTASLDDDVFFDAVANIYQQL